LGNGRRVFGGNMKIAKCTKCKKQLRGEALILNGKKYHLECYKELNLAAKIKDKAKLVYL